MPSYERYFRGSRFNRIRFKYELMMINLIILLYILIVVFGVLWATWLIIKE